VLLLLLLLLLQRPLLLCRGLCEAQMQWLVLLHEPAHGPPAQEACCCCWWWWRHK
jgi:hypothetical protein